MFLKLLLVIAIIYITLKLIKFIGKKVILLIIIILIVVGVSQAQTSDTTHIKENLKEIVKTSKEIVDSKEFQDAKETTIDIAEKGLKTIGKASATVFFLVKEGWVEKAKEKN